ncbi:hypothetical protein E1A91_D11G058600v1 [Gossypium mustelinum]|uniref:WEB family protein n=2 Tax=Gossypium TaxID=3633 RepID=A0A5J5P6N8_GOSBA|nr:hypothetical protein ES319_D11G057500v1 [Gossypium barbadense]TYI54194.1 hypothetical protein E1A91_D11G058600v1 [Gossypium mustelinum]
MGKHEDSNKRSNAMVLGKVTDIHTEVAAVKDSLTDAIEELKNKERCIESLKKEVAKTKELEDKLAEKEASFCKLKEELNKVKSFESEAMQLLSEGKKRIQELEEEVERRKGSEKKLHDSLLAQTKELEKTKVSLDECKQEIKSLIQNIEKLESSSDVASQCSTGDEEQNSLVEALESELQSTREKLGRAQDNERFALLKAKNLAEEVKKLQSELKTTIEAEENNKKAMDDFAVALKEVITEANQAKEKLMSTTSELETTKGQVEELKVKLKKVEEQYKEAKKETDRCKIVSERLRLEAEETLIAWNEKEMGFIECIKKAEYERNAALEDSKKSKEENHKLKDIMIQALNEANATKQEISQLKDTIAQKEAALKLLSQENERLKLKEASDLLELEDMGELMNPKPTDSSSTTPYSVKDLRKMEDQEEAMKLKSTDSTQHKENKDYDKEHTKKSRHIKTNSSCLIIKFPYKNKYPEEEPKVQLKDSDEDSDSDYFDPLKGSIFDVAETPKSEAVQNHHSKKPSLYVADDESMCGEEFHHFDSSHFDEETDKFPKKKRALFSRFSDLIGMRNFYKKEQPPLDQ